MLLPAKTSAAASAACFEKKAAVVADDDAALLPAPPRDLVGQRLAEPADVVHGEAFADDGPPAAGAESDQVLLLLAPRPEQPLLQDELGPRQVRGGVDALHFVLVVEPVALDASAGPNQLVHAIGQAVFAVDRRWRQVLQRVGDHLRIDHVRPDIHFADLAHLGRRLGVLDDVDDLAAGVADDAPVGQGLDPPPP